MTFGSLFSGIGGIDLGLERAGMQCKWQVEIDDYCRKVLEKHWPNVPRFKDIASFNNLHASTVPAVDLICGGFPCQPVSLAGKRKGKEDERWLWPEFVKALRLLRPRFVLVENTPGLLSLGMGDVFRDLALLGYDAEWDSIPAAAFGAPHLRYRVFVVAWNTDSGNGNQRKIQEIQRDKQITESSRIRDNVSYRTKEKKSESREHRKNVRNTSEPGFPNRRIFSMAESKSLSQSQRSDWWSVEPDVGRVAHGIPSRLDRLKGLGNAVVPQVAEWIGRKIMEVENDGRNSAIAI